MSNDPLGLTPKEIVKYLDQYIVGQVEAKKMVAIALRNRARRMRLDEALRDEVTPKNIIMIGPTGVGKTEISRRLSKMAGAPFIKVEATKYTEVGYVGRDVESMIRELTDIAINMVREEWLADVEGQMADRVRERLLDLIEESSNQPTTPGPTHRSHAAFVGSSEGEIIVSPEEEAQSEILLGREELARRLEAGELEDMEIEMDISQPAAAAMMFGMPMQPGLEEMGIDLQSMINNIVPPKSKRTRLSVAEARAALREEQAEAMIDQDKVKREAIERAEQKGIVFVDEIDKVAGRSSGHGPDVSREGVQRDILPIIEGSTVFTKHGPVRTDHILFIAAGAFHMSKPSDLIPELQGRFPLRVELSDLTAADFRRILTEPTNALTKQYSALLETESVAIEFTEDGIDELAESAYKVNQQAENIGARRLYTLLEKIMEDLAFDAPEMGGARVKVDRAFVSDRLKDIIEDQDLSKFIL